MQVSLFNKYAYNFFQGKYLCKRRQILVILGKFDYNYGFHALTYI